jgi:hypothetical protein
MFGEAQFPMKKLAAYAALVVTLTSIQANAQSTYTLNPLNNFGTQGDGSIRPGDSIGTNPQSGNDIKISAQAGVGQQPGDSTAGPNSIAGFNMRGLSADPVTGNLILVDTHTGSGGVTNGGVLVPPNAAIYVLNRDSGQIIGALSTNGMTTGSGIGAFVTVGVSADGAVYTANQINNSSNDTFRIYRWPTANPSAANFSEAPTAAFAGKLTPAERLSQNMDIRGSGPQTEIIIGTSSASGTGTNIYYFNTTDGTNFTAHRLSFPGIITPTFNDGIAFGPGNTFWTKQVGKPMYFLGYDPVNFTNNTVIATYAPTSPADVLQNLAAITYDPSTKLMAALEEIGGTANGGPGKLWLFDLSDPTNHSPAVLSSAVYPVNNVKATAPMGYCKFSNGRLYANVVNNGMLGQTVDTTPLSPPTLTTDLPATNRVTVYSTVHFEVTAVYDVTNYQWYSNNVAVVGANQYYLDIPNVTPSANGAVFKVVAMNAAGTVTSANSVVKVVDPSSLYHLQLLWSFSPGETNYLSAAGGTGTPPERTIAYNPISNQLLVVKGVANQVRIAVVNPDTGAFLYNLKTNGVSGGANLALGGIACAADGAVYACNTTADAAFRIYRWADTGPTTVPQVIWGTNSSAASYNPVTDLTGSTMYRWGDVLAARGEGINTEIVIDSQNSTKYAAVLSPLDSTMTNWAATSQLLLQNTPGSYGYEAYGTVIGHSIQFGAGNTFWQKRYNAAAGAPAARMGYTPTAGIQLSVLQSANTSLPLYTNASLAVNSTLNLAAAISINALANSTGTVPDEVDFYDFSDPTQALLLSRTSFKVNHTANQNGISQVIFGANPVTGSNYVFAIEGNNGAMALVLSGGVTPPPTFLTQPKDTRVLQGTTAGLTVTVDEPALLSWYKNNVDTGRRGASLTFTNATTNDSGLYYAVANNVYGTTTSRVAQVTIIQPSSTYSVGTLWTATPATQPYVSSDGGANTPKERAFAYNALSNQLIIVRCPPASTAYTVFVADAATGTSLYSLNTTGVVHEGASEVPGSNPIDLVAAGVADDGALYICSSTPNASGGTAGDTTKMFHLYRWADTGPTTAPVMVYEGDPSNQSTNSNVRWGDALHVRGAGTNTEVILNSNDGIYGAVLRPIDSSMATFTNGWYNSMTSGGSIGRSIQFGATNTVFEKRKGAPLFLSNYDLTNQNSSIIQTIDFASSTLGGVFVDTTHQVVAGVDFVGSSTKPDAVAFYEVSDPNTPMLLGRINFASNQVANANFISQVVIAGTNVFALDANNGMLALSITPPATQVQPPVLSIALSGSNVIVSWPQQGSFTLQGATALLNSGTAWTDIGTGTAANGQYVVTIPVSSQPTFYRLRQ